MYATVRTYSADAGLADGLVQHADEVKRVIGEIEGFRAYYLIRTPDGAVSVSVYDSQAGVDQSISVAAAWIRENLPEYAGSAPQVSAGEVVINA
jgi:heme-degrading monooxygenase HmoA